MIAADPCSMRDGVSVCTTSVVTILCGCSHVPRSTAFLSNNKQYVTAATTLFRIPLHSMMPPVQHPYAPSTAPLSPQHCNAPRVHASLLSTLMACSMHAQNLCAGPAAGLRLHPLHTRTHTHGRSRPPGVHATAGALLHRLKNQGLCNQIKTSISSLANVEFTYTLSGSWSSGMLG